MRKFVLPLLVLNALATSPAVAQRASHDTVFETRGDCQAALEGHIFHVQRIAKHQGVTPAVTINRLLNSLRCEKIGDQYQLIWD